MSIANKKIKQDILTRKGLELCSLDASRNAFFDKESKYAEMRRKCIRFQVSYDYYRNELYEIYSCLAFLIFIIIRIKRAKRAGICAVSKIRGCYVLAKDELFDCDWLLIMLLAFIQMKIG